MLSAYVRNALDRRTDEAVATWLFEPPSDEKLVQATIWRAGDADGGQSIGSSYYFDLQGPEQASSPFSSCYFSVDCTSGLGSETNPMAPENRVSVPPASLDGDIYATAGCSGFAERTCPEGSEDSQGLAAVVNVFAADIVLEQQVTPVVQDVAGELVSSGSLAGTADISFTASDPGSGIYEATFTVDGNTVQRTVLDEEGGRCRDIGETSDGLPAFLSVQPCPSLLNSDVGFDTSSVSNGPHHLVVSVIDAAGIAATVLDRQITVDNPGAPGPPNGADASSQAKLSVRWQAARGSRLLSRFGRAHDVVGVLKNISGAPISGALVEVAATPAGTAAGAASETSVHTGPRGVFRFVVPARVSSRTFRFCYRSTIGAAKPVATATLSLAVRAALTLSIAPRVTSVGRSIHFAGTVLGGPIPPEGKQLVLEARAPGGHWLEFDDVRTNSHGHYRASYRFHIPGPATYQFRVLSEPESDFPYSQGTSPTITVQEL